jgi:hypothetical protein
MKMVTTLGCKMGPKSKNQNKIKVLMKRTERKMQDETFLY